MSDYGIEVASAEDALIAVAKLGLGVLLWRPLPHRRRIVLDWQGGNGWRLAVSNRHVPRSYDDVYYIRSVYDAVFAMFAWNGEDEPPGWWRHLATARRRRDPFGHPDDVEVRE